MTKFISSYQKALDGIESRGKVKTLSDESSKELDKKFSDGFTKIKKEFKRMIDFGFISFNKSP